MKQRPLATLRWLLSLLAAALAGAGLTLAIQAWLARPPASPSAPTAIAAQPSPSSSPSPAATAQPTAAPPPATPATSASQGQLLETFDGQPSQPEPWRPSAWDVTIHSRDRETWAALEPMQAMHGADCGAPPASHAVSAYEQAVFLCRDHLMTAINAHGYAMIYLTPNRLVDFGAGEATISFDLSTLRSSQRDWVDLWITPYDDQLQLPLESWLPDVGGEPRNAIHIRMDTFNGQTIFKATLIHEFAATELPLASTDGYERVLTPDAKRRDTFELRISREHLRFGMPAYSLTWVDTALPDLGWAQGVVQFGHHSYNPTKECPDCTPNTWHWDNLAIRPSAPFTIIPAARRSLGPADNPTVEFPAPAPPGAHLRFAGIGTNLELSFDGGASWQAAQRQAQRGEAPEHFASYWAPIPAGVQRVQLRGASWWGGDWHVRDLSIWSLSH